MTATTELAVESVASRTPPLLVAKAVSSTDWDRLRACSCWPGAPRFAAKIACWSPWASSMKLPAKRGLWAGTTVEESGSVSARVVGVCWSLLTRVAGLASVKGLPATWATPLVRVR